MNNSKLNELLKNLYNNENIVDSKVQIYQDYSKFSFYYISHVLSDEKQVNKYVNIAFDNTFNYLQSNLCTSNEFLVELQNNLIIICNSQLTQTNADYSNWGENKFDFIPDIEERDDFSTNNSELYSDKYRKFILTMLNNLPAQEKIVAYTYYFFDYDKNKISFVLNVSEDIIVSTLKSIKYNIETNFKYLSNTDDEIVFSKSIIKNYLYTDLNTFSPVINNVQNTTVNTNQQNNPYLVQTDYSLVQPIQQYQTNAEDENVQKQDGKKTKTISTSKDNGKTLVWLLIILAVVVILAVVFLIVIGPTLFSSNNQTSTSTEPQSSIIPVTDIDFNEDEIYLYKGEEHKLNIVLTPFNTSYSNLKNIVDFDHSNSTESDWYYRIQDNKVLSYNPITQSIKALSVGTSQFKIISGKCESESGELIQDTIIVHVIDKINIFEFNENTTIVLENGSNYTLNLNISPQDARQNVIWKSSNENVAVVDDGQITSKGIGECVIVASIPTMNNGELEARTISVNIRVTKVLDKTAVVSATFDDLPLVISINQSLVISYTASPSDDYVKVDVKQFDNEVSYNSTTKTLTGLKSGSIIITLSNILTDELLDSKFITIE